MNREKVKKIQRKDSIDSRLYDLKNEDQYHGDSEYENVNDEYKKLTASENMIETEDTDEKEPDYYYYYYYDYTDPGIDSDKDGYEPLPTPLWQLDSNTG